MLSPHPLQLPEIISHVASYVQEYSLPACAQVSKAWYQALVPFLWRNVSLDRPPSPEAIKSNSRFIKSLAINFTLPQEYFTLRCPNLVSLSMKHSISPDGADGLELVANHPSLIHLELNGPLRQYPEWFWDKLVGFRHLKVLTLTCLNIGEAHIDKFWQLCTQLERLDIHYQRITGRGNLSCMQFPHLRELRTGYFYGSKVPLTLDFMQRCPGLRSFEWTLDQDVNQLFIPGFEKLISARTWPHLQSISTWMLDDEDDLSRIVGNMQQITHFCAEELSVTPKLMGLLQTHFSRLQILDLTGNKGCTSAMAQEIMSSCPLLTMFIASSIDAIDIVQGRPWVCLNLKVLNLRFCFDAATLGYMQPLVFDQLARLTRLEELYVNGSAVVMDSRHPPGFHELCDMRLVHGLGKLSTLRLLRMVNFSNTIQRMGEREVDWVLGHWRNLECIFGRLNTQDMEIDTILNERLQEHGIAN